jgi:hypothetical protein
MATSYKVLGQSAPSATTDTSLYTAPAATQTVVSTIFVCNRGTTAATFRIAIRPGGASIANQHYVAYDILISANATIPWTCGFTLAATDVITVRASNGDLSFSAFGSEVTA